MKTVIVHSLGTAVSYQVLALEPTYPPKTGLNNQTEETSTAVFHFDIFIRKTLFCLLGFFLLVIISLRRGKEEQWSFTTGEENYLSLIFRSQSR